MIENINDDPKINPLMLRVLTSGRCKPYQQTPIIKAQIIKNHKFENINFITAQIMPNSILYEITQSCASGNESEKAIFFMDFMTKFTISFFLPLLLI